MIEAFTDGALHKSARYTFERGRRRGETYEVEWRACDNPLCDCSRLDLMCSPGKPAKDGAARLQASLDVWDESLTEKPGDRAAARFARDLVEDLSAQDWDVLRSVFVSLKHHLTQQADLASLEAEFPRQDVEAGLLISYDEIIPFDDRIEVETGGQRFQVDDGYCLQPRCTCTETHLVFSPIPEDPSLPIVVSDDDAYVHLDLRTGRWRVEKPGPPPADVEVMTKAALEDGGLAMFRQRRRTLRTLYRNYLRKLGDGPATIEPVKVGRNETCPCGSGKKYKKCCLRKPPR